MLRRGIEWKNRGLVLVGQCLRQVSPEMCWRLVHSPSPQTGDSKTDLPNIFDPVMIKTIGCISNCNSRVVFADATRGWPKQKVA